MVTQPGGRWTGLVAVEVERGRWQLGHTRTKEPTTSVHAAHRIKAIVFSLITTVPIMA